VGTVKRERQKANRQQRLQELAKEARRNKSKRVGLRIFLVIAVVVGVVAVISFLGGDDDNPTAASTTVAGAEVPQVSVPEEEPTELKVTTINEGTGEAAKAGDSLEVFYVGARWEDGQQFQENYSSGSPIPVVLGTGGVIAGWDEGLVGVKAGGRYQLDIPAEMAYGNDATDRPAGALIFVVDIVSITPGEPIETTTTVAASTTAVTPTS